jgi:hypothetical protein
MTDQRIRAALDELAEGPAPSGLADRALAGAARNRRLRHGLAIGATAMAITLAVPAVAHWGRSPAVQDNSAASQTGAPLFTAGSVASGDRCVQLPGGHPLVKEVAPEEWPDFVQVTVAALPSRSDYVMQSGYSWCAYQDGGADAYAVVNLGHKREHGHVTVNMYIRPEGTPVDCAGVDRLASSPLHGSYNVLFCNEKTAATRLVYGLQLPSSVIVGSVYADGKTVVMESNVDGQRPLAISADQLRQAVLETQLHDVIPDSAVSMPAAPEPAATASGK